jgi:enoyl-CoA hydratase/carnithine racemase
VTNIHYEVRDHVAEILFDHPPVNALTGPGMDALLASLERARDDDAVRAVIIGSRIERQFCAGIHLAAFQRSTPTEAHDLIDKLYTKLCDAQFGLGKPSIAAIDGAVRGGGISVAISCDMIVAARSATFGYPEIDVGLLPAIHYTNLTRIVGRYRAFDLLFTSRTFTAEEAAQLGLVSRLAEDGQALDEARRIAQGLAQKSPQLMRKGKAAFNQAIDSGYRQGVAGAVNLFCTISAMEDSKEGLAAFVEKRKPVWKS